MMNSYSYKSTSIMYCSVISPYSSRACKAFERVVRIEFDVYNICKFMHAILAEMIVERGKSEVDPIIYQFPKFIPCEGNLISISSVPIRCVPYLEHELLFVELKYTTEKGFIY